MRKTWILPHRTIILRSKAVKKERGLSSGSGWIFWTRWLMLIGEAIGWERVNIQSLIPRVFEITFMRPIQSALAMFGTKMPAKYWWLFRIGISAEILHIPFQNWIQKSLKLFQSQRMKVIPWTCGITTEQMENLLKMERMDYYRLPKLGSKRWFCPLPPFP